MKKMSMAILCLAATLSLMGCGQSNTVKSEDKILMVNGTLYYGTEETGPMGDAGCIGGKILSSTEDGKIPTEDGQSNFGAIGSSFTREDGSGQIMVSVEEEWYWFKSEN